ncbi:MAG: polyprenol monophosphomannose synthase [Candidatus Omnitrophica bacterium]|nr:polyprenol monophosphomannose synthase [Candidatus Omnitrophota bacterium]
MEKALIIIPTYNENENIVNLMPAIFNEVVNNEFNLEYHILIVDDNSKDGTQETVEAYGKKFPVFILKRKEKLGLGTAYIEGFKWALKSDYQYIYEMDADWSHDPKYLLLFIRNMRQNNSFCVIGSRFYEWRVSVVNWELKRLILSLLGHRYVRVVLGNMNIYDTTSGFKCFRREAIESMNLDNIKSNGYIFQLELNYRLFKKKLKITEIPIIFKDRFFGKSKMSASIIHEGLWLPLKLKVFSILQGKKF